MATIRYALQVTVAGSREAKTLAQSDKDALFKRPTIESKKTKRPGNVTRAEASIPETDLSDEFTLEDIETGYGELIERADSLLETIKGRSKGLTFEFDPVTNPELSQAVGDLFKGEWKRITYGMYLEALRLDKDIAMAIGEESHGLK